MRLYGVADLRMEEAHVCIGYLPILEDGEGPKWSFKYDNFKNDPTPEILLLGAYRHPNTGNDLVGGINLHYLQPQQITELARVLPDIMRAQNLYQRYWTGKRLAPDVFQKNYRTYNADFIRGVTPGVMYPKFGFLQSTKNWFKKNIGGIFKTKQQRELDDKPQYPQDLADMQDQIRLVVNRLQQQAQARASAPAAQQQPEPSDTPEMQRAREAFQQFQREKAQRELDMPDPEDNELQRSYDTYLASLNQGRIEHQDEMQAQQQAQQAQQQGLQQPQQQPQQAPPRVNMARAFEQDRDENRTELQDPQNDLPEESIVYFSPKHRRYITESISISKMLAEHSCR